jgi:hypothetical protein
MMFNIEKKHMNGVILHFLKIMRYGKNQDTLTKNTEREGLPEPEPWCHTKDSPLPPTV